MSLLDQEFDPKKTTIKELLVRMELRQERMEEMRIADSQKLEEHIKDFHSFKERYEEQKEKDDLRMDSVDKFVSFVRGAAWLLGIIGGVILAIIGIIKGIKIS
jgi:hypothetical protein